MYRFALQAMENLLAKPRYSRSDHAHAYPNRADIAQPCAEGLRRRGPEALDERGFDYSGNSHGQSS